jgi:hypothetical protein
MMFEYMDHNAPTHNKLAVCLIRYKNLANEQDNMFILVKLRGMMYDTKCAFTNLPRLSKAIELKIGV